MAKVVRIQNHGGPEVLSYDDVDVGDPGAGEVRLSQTAIGVNFIDIYQRSGLYPAASFPLVLGQEGAGVVTAVGAAVTDLAVGDRVAYAGCPGSYATERLAPADRMIKLPTGIADQTAAAIMLKGMTVRMLFRETFKVGAGTVMLFHAAAGGVGLIAAQWARAIGATMIGTVSTAEKAELAQSYGCDHIVMSADDVVKKVRELTSGAGCDVVYDSVGRDTYQTSLACLKPKGTWVSFGNSSGAVPPFELALLKGSLFATRPSLFAYTAQRSDLLANANDVFEMVAAGKITTAINQTFPLAEAHRAHAALASRRTTGSIVLVP